MIAPVNGLYHPLSEQDIIDLIKYANKNNLQVRVRGAAGSAKGSVYTDDFNPAGPNTGKNINIQLDQMRSVDFDDAKMQVTVGAGCNLGFDPYDPSNTSSQYGINNLFYQLNQKGWAIQNVTDAIHQTIGGFISTGSAAGSLKYSFDACVMSITLIDGTGTRQVFNRSANLSDPFYAVGVSMGLFGIITSVTLQCVKSFNIIGNQAITPVSACAYDFFGPGTDAQTNLQGFLSANEFARTMWWPYKTLLRAVSWNANTMTPADYNETTGTPDKFIPKPYVPLFPEWLGSRLPSEIASSLGFTMIANWPDWLQNILGHGAAENSEKEKLFIGLFESIAPYLYPYLMDVFFKCDTPEKPAQKFWDNWLGSLPMDSFEFHNNMYAMEYTEFWFPVSQTEQVVNLLNTYYTANGYSATSFYTVELFNAKQSPFWMSPGYQQDSFRVNMLFFTRGAKIKPDDYFKQFWNLFVENKINYRLHWGKNLPGTTNPLAGPSYLQSQYPMWTNFMNMRKTYDPNNIFLTSYWANHLGIKS